jgi:hypothetical protein
MFFLSSGLCRVFLGLYRLPWTLDKATVSSSDSCMPQSGRLLRDVVKKRVLALSLSTNEAMRSHAGWKTKSLLNHGWK